MTETADRYNEQMKALARAKTQNFTELVRVLGLDPKKDFRLANLTGADFSGCDLRNYNFTGARLLGCTFKNALIAGAVFDQAEIGYAPPLPHDFFASHQEMPWSFWQERGKMLRNNDCDLSQAGDYQACLGQWQKPPKPLSTRHLPLGAVFQDAPFAPEMVMIPAGSFMMGSPDGEAGRYDDESLHEVTLTQPFAMGRYPVTFAQWDACVTDGGCTHNPSDEGWGRGSRPVINVSWQDVQDYIHWLNEKTGHIYGLPTEAQWEYAARAGSSTPFWFGNTITTDQANYDGNYPYNEGAKGELRGKTLPVASFEANPFGLYDMHGNVWEWVNDWYDKGYYKTSPANNPENRKSGSGRVIRGGCWNDGAGYLRSAYRYWNIPDSRYRSLGFRLMRQPS